MRAPGPGTGSVGFGAFELDIRAGELRKHGVARKLQEKPLTVLLALLEHPGELVARDELRQRIWPADTFVDFDHGLAVAVHKLRQALNDTSENPRFIETVARRGYRFIAPVNKLQPAAAAKKMLAVLPFTEIPHNEKQEYFADGLTEEVICQLGRLNPQRLGIIARTTSMAYKRTARPAREIASELGVDLLLEGSIRRGGAKVRISVQLIEAGSQAQLWSGSYERSAKQMFSVQTEVAEEVAASLAIQLLPERQAMMRRATPRSHQAHDLYLKGRYLWNRRTEPTIAEAVPLFEQAVEADPEYALAHCGLADCYSVMGYYGALPPADAFGRAKFEASRALELDERLAEAHCSLAFATLQYDWNWAAAEAHHARAIELNPNCVPAHHWYGLDLTQVGRFQAAHQSLQQALALDPLAVPVRAHVGRLFYFSRQNAHAASELRAAIQVDPGFAPAHYFLGLTQLQAGETADALESLRASVRLSGAQPVAVSGLAFGLARAGKTARTRLELKKLLELERRRYVSPYFLAFAAVGCEAPEVTFAYLERALEHRFGWMLYLKMEPAFDSLRTDPRFVELLQRTEPRLAAGTAV